MTPSPRASASASRTRGCGHERHQIAEARSFRGLCLACAGVACDHALREISGIASFEGGVALLAKETPDLAPGLPNENELSERYKAFVMEWLPEAD
jgi:hypothetical protein